MHDTNDRRMNRDRTQHRRSAGRNAHTKDEWICGLNPVLEAVRAGREVRKVFIAFTRRDRAEFEREFASRGISLQKTDMQFFDERFHKGHQGIAAAVAPREYSSLDEIMALPGERNEAPLFLLLDGVEDPRNFGSVLRVADAGGVHGIVVQSHRSASLTPEAVKSSAGASEHVQISMVPNIKHAMRAMKESGIFIIGAEADEGQPLWDIDLTGPLALVIGSEAEGMRKTVREQCDSITHLPMMGKVNSLNASVAAGIMIFEIMRQRIRQSKKHS